MLNFCDFIQVFVFTTNHHLKQSYLVLQHPFKITFRIFSLIPYQKVETYM